MSLNFSSYCGIMIPEGKTMRITRKLDDIILWGMKYINRVLLSINPDGTIYNNGLGYKNGYRIRSGGAETVHNTAACTGFIRVRGGDIVRIYGWNRYTNPDNASNAINVSDVNFTNIGQIGNANYGIFSSDVYAEYNKSSIKDGSDGVSQWVVPPDDSGVTYIRVTAFNNDGDPIGERMIVTINEEIVL